MFDRRTAIPNDNRDFVAVAAQLGASDDLAATLAAIANEARAAFGADRATCYVHDPETNRVTAVYTTEDDPARRAFLSTTIGTAPAELPILALQLSQRDSLLVVEDLLDDPRIRPALAARLGAGALLGVRLEHPSVGDGVIPALLGTLFCSYERPRHFSEADRQATRGLANLVSLALANARLRSQMAERLEENRALAAEQAALRRVATKVAAEDPPDEVFMQAAVEVAGLLEADSAMVARFMAEDEAVVVGTHGGHSKLGDRLPTAGDGALAQVVARGVSATIDDYSALEPGSTLRTHALAHGYRASVAIPVFVAGRLWGGLLATTKGEGAIASDAVVRLERFAELLALAIANAEARARLAAQATTDSLTGLVNHRAFFERLQAEAERAQRHGHALGLVVIDLDHFKRVNDGFGHEIGDHVLVAVAERLGSLARAEDTLARVGGEEFAWLLPESDTRHALAAAERARHAIGGVQVGGVRSLTLSAGAAQLGSDGSVNEMFRRADAALFRAKAQGRDSCLAYSPVHDQALVDQRARAKGTLSTSVERLVARAREQVGLPLAIVGEFRGPVMVVRHLDGDAEAFGMSVGRELRRSDTFCQRAADGRMPPVVRDVRRDDCTRDLPITRAANVGAYVGVPITLSGGGLYGTLSCFSPRAEPALGERDVRLLRLLASMIGEELEREQREEQKRADRSESIRRVLAGEGLSIVLQPIVELGDGRVVAAEALSRFESEPRRTPDVWFSEAAALGLGIDLELRAIAVALDQIDALPPGVRLSLNASPATVCSPALFELLAARPGERLALEVTEHAPVDDYATLEVALSRLRARGVQLVVDDAGAGFASFRHVLGLHPDVIKLDLSLTRDIDHDPVRRALAASLVAFNREIGSVLVAEGIETRAELETLRGLGVTRGQGYFLAAPAPGPVPPWIGGGVPASDGHRVTGGM